MEKIRGKSGKEVDNIGELIIKALVENGLYELAAIHAFNCCISENLKGMCEAERVEGKTLLVKATHSAIAQEISIQKENILRKINESLGRQKIKEIRVV